MSRSRLTSLICLVTLLGIALVAGTRSTRAIPFFHTAGDSDGDHLVDASDPQPAVYCAKAHADQNADGNINSSDLFHWAMAFGQEPAVDDRRDQNHNDAVDYLDGLRIGSSVGPPTVATACSNVVPDPIPPSGVGSTTGADLRLYAPLFLTGAEGNTSVTLATNGPGTDPFIGYYFRLRYNPAVVQEVLAKHIGPPAFCNFPADFPFLVDNVLGSVRGGCSWLGSSSTQVGSLAVFTFNVIAGGDPGFCIEPYTSPFGGPLRGTYTIGTDIAPQVQSMPVCGIPTVSAGGTIGVGSNGNAVMFRLAAQTASLRLSAPAAGPVAVTYYDSNASCGLGLPGISMPLVGINYAQGMPYWNYSVSFAVPASCTGSVFNKCVYVGITLIGCLAETLVDPSGVIHLAGSPTTPIEGATVTLERFDGAVWVAMDPVANAGQYTPLDNPEISLHDGRYGWDVAPGTYRVVVSKPGCSTVTSGSVTVPPPVTTLDFGLTCADGDGDGFGELQQTLHRAPSNTDALVDNCPTGSNPAQTNTEGNFVDNSPPLLASNDDKTWPNSDMLGDACDPDDDNDGISDVDEGSGAACAGIVTNPVLRDTDGDRVLDGPECALGTSPTSAASKPTPAQCGVTTDSDGDRLSDRAEYCGYDTDPNNTDTDGDRTLDGAKDGCEAASLNGDRVVNSGDQLLMVFELLREATPSLRLASYDINKDGAVNAGDQLLIAQFISPSGQCP